MISVQGRTTEQTWNNSYSWNVKHEGFSDNCGRKSGTAEARGQQQKGFRLELNVLNHLQSLQRVSEGFLMLIIKLSSYLLNE